MIFHMLSIYQKDEREENKKKLGNVQ